MDWSDLVGVPYRHHGRSLDGTDCYGLVIEFERRLGRDMLDLDYGFADYRRGEEYGVWESSMEKWKRVGSPSFGDVVLFYDAKGRVIHAAVCVDENRILHCDVRGSRVDRLSPFYYRRWRAYRWRQ